MSIISVDHNNIHLLRIFIGNIGTASKSFRYFNHRSANVIDGHLVTLLLLQDKVPIAYGHLELENEIVWLGICVLPEFSGKGYGSKMMTALINQAKIRYINFIYLTVDVDNRIALNLYHKFKFCKIEVEKNRWKCFLDIYSSTIVD